MGIRVYAWDVDPELNWERYLYRASYSSCEAGVEDGRGAFRDLANGHRVFQKYAGREVIFERGARNQILVLARPSNKRQGVILHPPRLHYPCPKAGEHIPLMEIPRFTERRISVSHRHRFNRQPLNGDPIRPEV